MGSTGMTRKTKGPVKQLTARNYTSKNNVANAFYEKCHGKPCFRFKYDANGTQESMEPCMTDEEYVEDEDKNISHATSEDAAMDKVTHKMITGEDGREGGWLNNRDISFTKHYDDTYVRVIYYDNMRCHGHTSHGMWELEFCDGGGGGCAQCNNPGRLMHWRWSGHQHGWWMNDHTGGTITGLCKSTNNMQLTKGDYQIKVYLRDNRYDLYTGQKIGRAHV